jgi:hypothetical protein
MLTNYFFLVSLFGLLTKTSAFVAYHQQQKLASALIAFLTPSSDVAEVTEKGMLKRDRYVATNRFAVRQNKAAKFEKRWATRKSRLATLQGFKYFHLMRRVTIDEETGNAEYCKC